MIQSNASKGPLSYSVFSQLVRQTNLFKFSDSKADRFFCTMCPASDAGFTPDAEATPKRGVSANPWRAGAWLVAEKIDSTPKRSLHGAKAAAAQRYASASGVFSAAV
ncbi:unnamed protein product [Pleuronectes platessa]|uniref:Uncharacterized protein n=1 Tax=Pleuronectes platessa TaxID=8262 RepID=A0A9N7TKH9_PLEPL|nr:unnamed protein product [Pleuronectes platessa]